MGCIASVLGCIGVVKVSVWLAIGVLVGGTLASYISALFLYGFGDIIVYLKSLDISAFRLYEIEKKAQQQEEK